jgi:hypothetical protein
MTMRKTNKPRNGLTSYRHWKLDRVYLDDPDTVIREAHPFKGGASALGERSCLSGEVNFEKGTNAVDHLLWLLRSNILQAWRIDRSRSSRPRTINPPDCPVVLIDSHRASAGGRRQGTRRVLWKKGGEAVAAAGHASVKQSQATPVQSRTTTKFVNAQF